MVTRAPKSGSERILKVPDFIFEELEKKKQYNATLLRKAKKKRQKLLFYFMGLYYLINSLVELLKIERNIGYVCH